MLQLVSAIKGFSIEAQDGAIGTVSDFLFDDSTWKVRWLVVDTGSWLSQRKVLVHPSAIGVADYGLRALPVMLTKAQVEESPDILQDRPVSRQMQSDLCNYYGWDPLWGAGMVGPGMAGSGLFGAGMGAVASPLSAPAYFGVGAAPDAAHGGMAAGDPHLRSAAEVTGYHVHASDGDIGHVEDFLIAARPGASAT